MGILDIILIIVVGVFAACAFITMDYKKRKYTKIAQELGLNVKFNSRGHKWKDSFFGKREVNIQGHYKEHQIEIYDGPDYITEEGGATVIKVDGKKVNYENYRPLLIGFIPNFFVLPDIKAAIDDYIDKKL